MRDQRLATIGPNIALLQAAPWESLLVLVALLAGLVVLALATGLNVWRVWREGDRRQRRLAVAGFAALGAFSVAALVVLFWMPLHGDTAAVLDQPFDPNARPYTLTLLALTLGFVVLWLIATEIRLRNSTRYQIALGETNRRLRHHTEELEEFSYALSHDLRSPLVAVDSLVDELRERVSDPGERVEIIDRVQGQLDQMHDLIQDLLTLAHVEREARADQSHELHRSLSEVRDVFAPALRSRQISLDESGLVPTQVYLPRSRLRQILQNLVANAIQHGNAGGTIRVRAEDEGEMVRIEVADDGPGVPLSDRERIFQAFHRGTQATPSSDGNGIGLALVRKIARTYGGRAWVEDAPGGGAAFSVLVPGELLQASSEEALAQPPDMFRS